METGYFKIDDIQPSIGWENVLVIGSTVLPSAEVQLNLFEEPHPELFEDGAQ